MSYEIGYAAGLFEGEGSIHAKNNADKGSQHKSYTPVMSIGMTDIEPLEKFLECVKMGKIVGPYKNGSAPGRENYKPIWQWRISDKKSVNELCEMLYPHLSPRRQAQIDKVLEIAGDNKHNSLKTHCVRGHELNEENCYTWKKSKWPNRRCRLCHNERQNEYRRIKRLERTAQ